MILLSHKYICLPRYSTRGMNPHRNVNFATDKTDESRCFVSCFIFCLSDQLTNVRLNFIGCSIFFIQSNVVSQKFFFRHAHIPVGANMAAPMKHMEEIEEKVVFPVKSGASLVKTPPLFSNDSRFN